MAIEVIVPIAHDLAYDNNGVIICGPGTKRACDEAIELALRRPDARLFVSATKAPQFENIVMGRVMQQYLLNKAPALRLRTVFQEADYFNTLGEVLAVAKYIQGQQVRYGASMLFKVTFTVKAWHAERVRKLANEVFEKYGLNTQIKINHHDAPGSFTEKLLEPLKTWLQLRTFRKMQTLG